MNEIVKIQPQAMRIFGDEDNMNFMVLRTATVFQVPQEEMGHPDVMGALIKAAQWCWAYGAMPGKHIHLIPFNKKETDRNGVETYRKVYAVSDSYEWRKASADIKANQNRTRYMVQTVEMTAQEVADYVTQNQRDLPSWAAGPPHPNDRGFKARVLFAHEMEIIAKAKALGMKDAVYEPAWHYGFWRQNVKQKTSKGKVYWEADNVPNGRTRDWVALKRAEKSALAEHFELQPLTGWESKSEAAKLAAVEDATPEPVAQGRASDRALFANRPGAADIDDWMTDDPVKSAADDLLPEAEFKELEPLDPNPPPPPARTRSEILIDEIQMMGVKVSGTAWQQRKAKAVAHYSDNSAESIDELPIKSLELILATLQREAEKLNITTGK